MPTPLNSPTPLSIKRNNNNNNKKKSRGKKNEIVSFVAADPNLCGSEIKIDPDLPLCFTYP